MKWITSFLLLMLLATGAGAAETAGGAGEGKAPGADQRPVSEKGTFRLELDLKDPGLQNGLNAFDVVLTDGTGQAVEGALLAVTPWMPTMGHGVWEKPAVKERGGGRYRVENVVIIMPGLWQLKFDLRKGGTEDRAVFTTYVAEAKPVQQEPAPQQRGYQRTVASYAVPNVTLINQDGKKVDFRALLESGKPVVMDFIFTTCTTICPVLSAGFTNLRKELGADAEQVQLVSITIDPENDRPEKLKSYLKRFNGGPGWEFLTGSRDDVGKVLRAFDAFVVDKMSHQPLYLLHAPDAPQWVRIQGLIKKSDLVREYRGIERR